MVSVMALWLPILVGAVLVFIVSSIIHVVLKYHDSDFGGVPNEDGLRAAMRELNIPPGDYMVPHCGDSKNRNSDEFKAKVKEGPVVIMTVHGDDPFNMSASLTQWFLYCILIGVFAAYVTGLAYGPGAEYMEVFRMSATVAFAGYGLAILQQSIWLKRDWTSTGKSVFDALVYGLLTAGVLGWLWPGA